MVELGYFTLAERTVYWLNTLLTGHGPEAAAARSEKYRSAHHCDVIVEAEDGISLEWLKEDYELGQVECYNRDQDAPGKLQFSYSCKSVNFGGVLEGVVVLELLARPAPNSDTTLPVAEGTAPIDRVALQSAGRAGLDEVVSNTNAETPGLEKACDEVHIEGPVTETRPRRLQSFKSSASGVAALQGRRPESQRLPSASPQAEATQVARPPLEVPTPSAVVLVVQPAAEEEFPLRRAPSTSKLFTGLRCVQAALRRRWCPARRLPVPPTSEPPHPSPVDAVWPSAPTLASAAVAATPGTSAVGQAPRPPSENRSDTRIATVSAAPPLPVGIPDPTQACDSESESVVTDSAAVRETLDDHHTEIDEAHSHSCAAGQGPAVAQCAPQDEGVARAGLCAIYFSVEPNRGNKFGVCCLDDKSPQYGSASEVGGEASWWTVCTRRSSKVERHPSKTACWRASGNGMDEELKASRPVFGAHERMPWRRQDSVGVSVAAEMTSCMDATLKVKLKFAEPIASSTIVVGSVPRSEPAPGLVDSIILNREPPSALADARQLALADAEALARKLAERATEQATEDTDLPADPLTLTPEHSPVAPPPQRALVEQPTLSAHSVAAEEVVVDVACLPQTPPPLPSAQLQLQLQLQAAMGIQATEIRAADTHSPSSPPHPWDALRQGSSSEACCASPPVFTAIPDIDLEALEDASTRRPLGAALLAVASAPPPMSLNPNEAPFDEVQVVSVLTGSGVAIKIPEQVVPTRRPDVAEVVP